MMARNPRLLGVSIADAAASVTASAWPEPAWRKVKINDELRAGVSRSERTTSADDVEAWNAWFESLGTSVIDFGHQVRNVRTLNGNAGTEPKSLVLTGYVVISADSKESAVRLASGCPGLASGFKVEVGEAVDA